jgi:glycosyltransferase involved in cell wall biosynthesis
MIPTISYAITACNEHEELKRLITQLETHIGLDDEIIIQIDTSATQEVRDLLAGEFIRGVQNRTVIEFPLQKDFATFKNNIKNVCKKDYIIFIDADEYLDENFLINLPYILEMNPEVDLYYVPRWNTVRGLTQEHIVKWGWHVDSQNRINWPDLQSRIMKNTSEIYWKGKVHERLEGFKSVSRLPDDFRLYHPKTIEKQEKQNKLYEII